MAGRQELVLRGSQQLVESILKDLRGGPAQQLRALDLLQQVTRGKAAQGGLGGGPRTSAGALQGLFLERGGLPLLLQVLEATARPGQREPDLTRKATRALAALVLDSAAARREAREAGCLQVLCAALSLSAASPVCLETLRALHSFVAADTTGTAVIEVFASGGVTALLALLDHLQTSADTAQLSAWLCEVLALLNAMAAQSRSVARTLLPRLGGVLAAMAGTDHVLTVSLGLDILEEALTQAHAAEAAAAVCRQGGLLALAHCLLVRGLAPKALGVLALILRSPSPAVLPALRCLLAPAHYRALCKALREATSKGDLADRVCSAVLGSLFGSGAPEGLGAVRGVVLGMCTATVLQEPALQELFLTTTTSPEGELLVANLGERAPLEAAAAAAHVWALRGGGAPLGVLLRPQAPALLVSAALDEVVRPESQTLPFEATAALVALLRALAQPPSSAATPPTAKRHSSSGGSGSSHPQPQAPSEPPSRVGSGSASEGSQHSTRAQDSHRTASSHAGDDLGTIAFQVGGRQFFAPGWMLARASSTVHGTLQGVADPSRAVVIIPSVEGVPDARLYGAFGLAVACVKALACGQDPPAIPPGDALDLWLLAADLQMAEVRGLAEGVLCPLVAREGWELPRVLRACALADSSSSSAGGPHALAAAAAEYVATHLEALAPQGDFRELVKGARPVIQAALTARIREGLALAAAQQSPELLALETPTSARSSALGPGDGASYPQENGH